MSALSSPYTVGIIGGGQLGRMMIYRAKKLGFRFAVLDARGAPAEVLADIFVEGGLKDAEALRRLSQASDVLTYEIEHINTAALEELQADGRAIYPSPATLRIIQDKLSQKRLFTQKDIPSAAYFSEDDPAAADFSKKQFPLVQKARREGYDGRGVRVLRNPSDERLPVPSLFEDMIDIDKELAVMAARGRDGSVAVYPVVEMAFNPRHNICDTVIAPARIDEKTAARARDM
ncbi:MAG: ATP-grasp domain-containing protein, partial [Spirochaetales bacterium]|nr:ATP-grasp domain-containing protein [Spirochaetales bacterium]